MSKPKAVSQVDPPIPETVAELTRLLIKESCQKNQTDLLRQIENLLERLAIATAEYDLARTRVQNARRYFIAAENGAAAYELRMLIGMLRLT